MMCYNQGEKSFKQYMIECVDWKLILGAGSGDILQSISHLWSDYVEKYSGGVKNRSMAV